MTHPHVRPLLGSCLFLFSLPLPLSLCSLPTRLSPKVVSIIINRPQRTSHLSSLPRPWPGSNPGQLSFNGTCRACPGSKQIRILTLRQWTLGETCPFIGGTSSSSSSSTHHPTFTTRPDSLSLLPIFPLVTRGIVSSPRLHTLPPSLPETAESSRMATSTMNLARFRTLNGPV